VLVPSHRRCGDIDDTNPARQSATGRGLGRAAAALTPTRPGNLQQAAAKAAAAPPPP